MDETKDGICEICKIEILCGEFFYHKRKTCSDKCRLIKHALMEANKIMRKHNLKKISLKDQIEVLLKVFLFLFLFSAPLLAQPDFDKMCDAVYRTEGGAKTKHPFGVLSVPCSGYEECRKITLNSLRNSWSRYQKTDMKIPFDEFFQKRWSPVGAENDPNGLNKNWLSNFRFFMSRP